MWINKIKEIDINENDNEINIKFDVEEKDTYLLISILETIDEDTKLTKNTLNFLSNNLHKIKNLSIFTKLFYILNNNCYEVNLSNEYINELLENASFNFHSLIDFYNILKKVNKHYDFEDLIAEKLSHVLPYTDDFYTVDYKEKELRELLNKYLEDYRRLLTNAIKIFSFRIVNYAINSIPSWLKNPKRNTQYFSYFLRFVNVLKDYNLEDLIKEEIEILKNELKVFESEIRRAIRNRIKKEEYRNEILTLIDIINDKALYKYLL